MQAPTASRVRQFARAGLAAVLPRRFYLVRGPRRGRSVCLTFDDGPHPIHTPRYLELLAEHRVKATFFVIGENAERHPDLVRRMVADGHAVGNHSYSHPRRDDLSAQAMAEDIARGARVIQGICGGYPTLYRPPRGAVTACDLWGLFRHRRTVVLWNVDPKDYANRDPAGVAGFFRDRPLRGGDLVLFHDTHPHALSVLPGLIAAARHGGVTFVPVPEWLGRAGLQGRHSQS